MFDFELPEKIRRYVPLLIWALVISVLLAIPLKIIGDGFLPGDDALRHVAKAVSGKSWPEILVLGDSFKLDHNFGWHAALGWIQRAFNWGVEPLLVFSLLVLFFIVNAAALPWLKRPEAWLAPLLVATLISDVPQRFMLGRPFLLTAAVLVTVLFAAQKSKPSAKHLVLFAGLIALCSFVHGVWYLWLLPVAAFFSAGQFGWTLLLFIAWLVGISLAAIGTGHPVDYFSQALAIASESIGLHHSVRTQATELQPFNGEILAVILLGAIVALRVFLKPVQALPFSRNPAFWLVCGTWLLGFRISRFWEDWGWPALMVLAASEFEWLLMAKMAGDSCRRLLLTLILVLASFLALTSDLGGRWTQNLSWSFLAADNPELSGWMPEPGGILYSPEMAIFYRTFYKNPRAEWRYQTGYEPALMPAADFEIYRKILESNGDASSYAPWVQKMKPADRLVIRGNSAQRPNIPQLEWHQGVSGLWLGRTPR